MKLKKVDEIIDKYDSDRSWLVMILQDVQQEYNYLPGRRSGTCLVDSEK